jgi:hypothetical protein
MIGFALPPSQPCFAGCALSAAGEYANNGISSANASAGCGWARVARAGLLTDLLSDSDDYA